jgi:histidine triad (HIT) family protein
MVFCCFIDLKPEVQSRQPANDPRYERGNYFRMETDCIFCQIALGRTDTDILFQTDTLVVFKDINPHAPVHLLVVPKKHIRSINDLTDADQPILSELIMVARKMAKEHGVSKSGYKLLFNVERGGGQVIFHLHLHLIGGFR